MGYSKSVRALNKIRNQLNELLDVKDEMIWRLSSVGDARNFAYQLRNGLNYAHENGILPYCNINGKVREEGNRVIFKANLSFAHIRPVGKVEKPDGKTFTDLMLWQMQNESVEEIDISDIKIEENEEEFFVDWKRIKEFTHNGNRLKRNAIEEKEATDLS